MKDFLYLFARYMYIAHVEYHETELLRHLALSTSTLMTVHTLGTSILVRV